jgi:hypothetical protein
MLAGQFVTCLTRKYSQLQFGIDYQIERVTRIGSLKFVGYGHLYDRKNFALVGERVNVPQPVKPKPAPVVKKTLAEELIAKVNAVGGAGTCSYAIEFASGHRRFQSNDACHARMRWGKDYGNNDKDGDKVVAVACNIHGHIKNIGPNNLEAYTAFVKYMLNDSPWADAWLTKDVDEAMKGCAMMDVTKHFSYVCSAAIALRTGSEYPRFLKVFKQLIDMKYSPNVAYIMSQMTTVGNNGSYDITGQGGSHHVFHNHMDLSKVVAFFDDKKLNVENKPYNESEKQMYTIFRTMADDTGFKHGNPSIISTITNANKEFVYVNKTGWSNYETVKAKDFNEYLKIVNTFARNFK